MSFFDELKQPAPRREEPVLTPEEAAEAEVLRRLADPEVQRVAAEMARTIRSACLEARDRGERRIYGLVTGFRDSRSEWVESSRSRSASRTRMRSCLSRSR